MNLSEMKPSKLWEFLELNVKVARGGWNSLAAKALRAELKRRCACAGELVCPCPVVGKEERQYYEACVKCGRCQYPWELRDGEPCRKCVNSHPSAPSGYEFTGEWGPPGDRPWLTMDGFAAPAGAHAWLGLDGGKRWILREVSEPEPATEWTIISGTEWEKLTRRVEKLEKE